MTTPGAGHVVGLDVGSTYIKGLLVDPEGTEVASARRSTPWRSLADGCAEMAPSRLLEQVVAVLGDLSAGRHVVAAIGVSGMAESGVLLTPDDRVIGPIIAWFDPRGHDDPLQMPDDLRERFAGVTGLPLGPLATFTKLWHRSRHHGLELLDRQWLNVPELVAWWLGGVRRCEVSLVARTGLLDQDTVRPWVRAVDALGASPSLVPEIGAAGSSWGLVSRNAPRSMEGAVVTVAGHDHLVSSVASGVLDLDTVYDSIGTAEALVRVLEGVLDPAARARLAAHGVNVSRHLLPGRGVMLAGTKAGLVMRRILQLIGVTDLAGRAALDGQVMALVPGGAHGDLVVTGAANDDGELCVRTGSDGLSPALLFEAALREGNEVLRGVLARMDAENPAAARSVIAGGWAHMRSVRRARQALLPDPRLCERDEDTAYGAALIAAFAASPDEHDLESFLTRRVLRPGTGRVAGSGTVPHPTPQGTP